MIELIIAAGIPSAICGVFIWFFKKYIDKLEAKREKREESIEKLMGQIINCSHATNVLAEATAKAVQRIPEAHCNGDMTKALEDAHKLQEEERKFLTGQAMESLF